MTTQNQESPNKPNKKSEKWWKENFKCWKQTVSPLQFTAKWMALRCFFQSFLPPKRHAAVRLLQHRCNFRLQILTSNLINSTGKNKKNKRKTLLFFLVVHPFSLQRLFCLGSLQFSRKIKSLCGQATFRIGMFFLGQTLMKTEGEAETFFPYICHRDLFFRKIKYGSGWATIRCWKTCHRKIMCVSANILNILYIYIYVCMSWDMKIKKHL